MVPPCRILVLSQHYWPESFRINSFVEALIAEGADVTVLTGQPNYPAGKTFAGYRGYSAGREQHPSGYEILRVPLVPRGSGGAIRLALNYLSFMLTASLLGLWHLRGRRFDAIFVYGTSPILQGFAALPLRWQTGGKVVLWVQDLWPDAPRATGFVKNIRMLGIVQKMVGILYRRCNLILAQSNSFASAVTPFAGSVPVEYFPNPGDPVPSSISVPSVRLPTDTFNIVFAGNLGRAQGLETIVAAAEMLKLRSDIHFTLFGQGAMHAWTTDAVTERGLSNMTLPGQVPSEAIPGIFDQASALLLTLVPDEMVARTIPSKLQSYLAAGVPIVSAAGGEAAAIVDASRSGVVCAPGDAAALANAVISLADLSVESRREMGEAGKRHYNEHFEPTMLAKRLIDRLHSLAQDAKS